MPADERRRGLTGKAARAERARQLRAQIKGSGGGKRKPTPRELTDEAAEEEYRKDTQRPCSLDVKKP
jgi:hypothetical protein